MILLDPDLDQAPASLSKVVKPSSAQAKPKSAPAKSSPLLAPSPRALARFLTQAQAVVKLRGHVTVLLTTDASIRSLNRRFRGKNKATDVLSFPAAQTVPAAKGVARVAGDLAIGVPIARRQATAQGHTLSTEIKVLILHGLLHLAGYDHEADSGQMERRERRLRARLGLPQGLIERAANQGPTSKSRTSRKARAQ
jgi:probable rRNA maturation factor